MYIWLLLVIGSETSLWLCLPVGRSVHWLAYFSFMLLLEHLLTFWPSLATNCHPEGGGIIEHILRKDTIFPANKRLVTGHENIKVWAPSDKLADVHFAADIGPKIIEYYEQLFNISFPLAKLDMAAIPDFRVCRWRFCLMKYVHSLYTQLFIICNWNGNTVSLNIVFFRRF